MIKRFTVHARFALRLLQPAVVFLFLIPAARSQVVINEILFSTVPDSPVPERTHQWLELFNAGTQAVDLTNWSISARDGKSGTSSRLLPPVSLPPGAYLTVHITSGANQLDFSNGSGVFYTGDSAPLWNTSSDEAALYSDSAIVDFLAWAAAGVAYKPGGAGTDAVAAKIWNNGDVIHPDAIHNSQAGLVSYLDSGDSLGRDAKASDTNSTTDFEPHGGLNAFDITPGAVNQQQAPSATGIPFDPSGGANLVRKPRDARPRAKWTVMLYFGTDNNLSYHSQRALDNIAGAGGSTDDVNFVALWDSLGTSANPHQTILGRVGPMQSGGFLGFLPDRQNHATLLDARLIPHLNTADPKALSFFIQYAQTAYPAERYGLLILTHGSGWKGIVTDDNNPGDQIHMAGLSNALATLGQPFEWLVFESCLMGGVEVASQVRGKVKYLLASEEIMWVTTFPWATVVPSLSTNPNQQSVDLATQMVTDWSAVLGNIGKTLWTVSLTDVDTVPDLLKLIDRWANELYYGVSVLNSRDDPADNVQNRMRLDAIAVDRFSDDNFIDLGEFARKIDQDPAIPKCAKVSAQPIRDQLHKTVLRSFHGSAFGDVEGLSIHFPRYRTFRPPVVAQQVDFMGRWDSPYDAPYARIDNASSPLAAYAPNPDDLPLRARDEEHPEQALMAPAEWPRKVTPNFAFIQQTQWARFLNRFYHPVADNHIVGTNLPPFNGCDVTPDAITVSVGTDVQFSGAGSSDGDMPSSIRPLYYFWDLDSTKDCRDTHPADACKAPSEVGPNADPALDSNNLKDQDRFNHDTVLDDDDARGVTATMKCTAPGTFLVTLHVWDDNHQFGLHNTDPDSPYVHPQSDSQVAVVTCKETYTYNQRWYPGGIYVNYGFPYFLQLATASGVPLMGLPVTVDGGTAFTVSANNDAPLNQPNAAGLKPRAAGVTATSDRTGMVRFNVLPKVSGVQQVKVSAPGFADSTAAFIVIQPGSGGGSQIKVAAPASVPVNTAVSLPVSVLDQPGSQSQVTYIALSNNVRFNDGAKFAGDSGTQANTNPAGNAQASFTATGAGAVVIGVYSGTAYQRVSIPVTGGSLVPDSATLAGVPPTVITSGTTGTITVTIASGTQPVGGVPVNVRIEMGGITVIGTPNLVTDSKGVATFQFTADVAGSVRLSFDVPSVPALSRKAYFAIAPAAR